MDDLPDSRQPGIQVRDVVIALGLALAFGFLYAATMQTRLTGDGAGLATFHALDNHGYYNILYLPVCDLVQALCGGEDPIRAPRLVSVLGAALGLGCTWLVVRAFHVQRFEATVATLLVGTSPALWFFATTIEVHALHFGMVGLCACVTLLGPWRRTALPLALTALVFPLLYWTQQTAVTLGIGWVLLVAYASGRKGTPFTWPALLLGVGPLLLASLCLAIATANHVRFDAFGLSFESQLSQIGEAADLREDVPIWWVEWMRPLALLLAAAALGLFRQRFEPRAQAALAGLLLPPLVFFLWWGVPERGGYFLPSTVFLAVLASQSFRHPGTTRAIAATLLVGLQAWLALRAIDAYDQGYVIEERVEIVEDLLYPGGLFVSTVETAPAIAVYLPEVEEIDLREFLVQAWLNTDGRIDPDFVTQKVLPYVELLLAEKKRLVLELGYRGEQGRRLDNLVQEYMEPLVEALQARYATELREHPWWPMLIVRAR